MKATSLNKLLVLNDEKIQEHMLDPMCFVIDSAPAIDKGFDYMSFPHLTNEEKVYSLPKPFVEEIELYHMETFLSHKHEMKQHSPKHHTHWRCDKIKDVSKCMSSDIPKYQTLGGWRCNACDFDLCTKCARTDKCMKLMGTRED